MNASPKYYTYNTEEDVVCAAMQIMESQMRSSGVCMQSSDAVKKYVTARLKRCEREVFFVMFLNTQHHLIYAEDVYTGTINACTVYPRDIAKLALLADAESVILAHNHPSGDPAPSTADKLITSKLIEALNLLDIRVLDHIIVGDKTISLTEMGIINQL